MDSMRNSFVDNEGFVALTDVGDNNGNDANTYRGVGDNNSEGYNNSTTNNNADVGEPMGRYTSNYSTFGNDPIDLRESDYRSWREKKLPSEKPPMRMYRRDEPQIPNIYNKKRYNDQRFYPYGNLSKNGSDTDTESRIQLSNMNKRTKSVNQKNINDEEETEGCNNFACKKNGGFCLVFWIFAVVAFLSLFLFLIAPLSTWVKILLMVVGALLVALFAFLIFWLCKTGRMVGALVVAILVYLVLIGMVFFAIFYPTSDAPV
jgi:hypothetical protein